MEKEKISEFLNELKNLENNINHFEYKNITTAFLLIEFLKKKYSLKIPKINLNYYSLIDELELVINLIEDKKLKVFLKLLLVEILAYQTGENFPLKEIDSILNFLDNIPFISLEDYQTFFNEYLNKVFTSKRDLEDDFTLDSLKELIKRITFIYKNNIKNIYNPASGINDLILSVLKDKEIIPDIYGYEENNSYFNLGIINLLINEYPLNKIHIENQSSLSYFNRDQENQFDLIVSELPTEISYTPLLEDEFIKELVPIEDNSSNMKPIVNLAYIFESSYKLNKEGVGILLLDTDFINNNQENEKIHQFLINSNIIDSVILLSKNLYFKKYSPIVLILNKNKKNNTVKFIDARNIFTQKRRDKRYLLEEDINKIIELIKSDKDINRLVKFVDNEEIKKSEYNLNPYFYLAEIIEESFKKYDTLENLTDKIFTGNYRASSRSANKLQSENCYLVTLNDLNKPIINHSVTLESVFFSNLRRLIEYNDILLTRNFTNLKASLFSIENLDLPVITGDNIYIIKPDLTKIDPFYLLYFLNSKLGKEQIEKMAPRGKIIKSIDLKTLKNIKVPLVSLEKQKKIGENYLSLLYEEKRILNELEKIRAEIETFSVN